MNIKNVIKTGLAIYGGTALAVEVIVVPFAKRIMAKHDAAGVYTLYYTDYAHYTKWPRSTTIKRYNIHKGGKASNE